MKLFMMPSEAGGKDDALAGLLSKLKGEKTEVPTMERTPSPYQLGWKKKAQPKAEPTKSPSIMEME